MIRKYLLMKQYTTEKVKIGKITAQGQLRKNVSETSSQQKKYPRVVAQACGPSYARSCR
jgi:hypothetical protein